MNHPFILNAGRAVFFMMVLQILSLLCSANVNALSTSDISITPALNGLYVKGRGVPLKLTIENTEGNPVEGDIRITGGLMEYGIAVRLEPHSGYEKWIIAYPAAGSGLMMRFIGRDGVTFNKEVKTSQFISKKRLAINIAKDRDISSDSAFNAEDAVSKISPQELWDIWKGYEGADYVLLDADAVELMTAPQLKALKEYALSGGSLYIGESRYPEIYRQKFFQEILPYAMPHDGLRISHDGKKRAMHIPAGSSAEERGKLFRNVMKWNTAYLILLAVAGFACNKKFRKFLWPLLSILVVITSLASMGMLNGRNRARGVSVVNIRNDKDAFIQSRLNLLSVTNAAMSAEFEGGFIYPADNNGKDIIKISETGNTQKITSDMMMLGHRDVIWERFENINAPLNADLNISPEGINGSIENLSAHRLKNVFILMNGRFFSLPQIEPGQKISVNILYEKDNGFIYPEGRLWIREYIRSDEEGSASHGMKIAGIWEKPLLKSLENGLSVDREETYLLYHM
ncbi:MAG: hypothetical protein HY809_08960 [Nitrospirae bacterium]|nr:hypothetical protein [Nitrospirota bacterium]